MRRYIIRILGGWALWVALFAAGYSYLTGNGFPSWLPGHIGFVAALASMPIGFGGWVYVWATPVGSLCTPGSVRSSGCCCMGR